MTRRNPLLAKPPKGFNRFKQAPARLDKLDSGVNLTDSVGMAGYYAQETASQAGGKTIIAIVHTDCHLGLDYDVSKVLYYQKKRDRDGGMKSSLNGYVTYGLDEAPRTLLAARRKRGPESLSQIVYGGEPYWAHDVSSLCDTQSQWKKFLSSGGRLTKKQLETAFGQYRCARDVDVIAVSPLSHKMEMMVKYNKFFAEAGTQEKTWKRRDVHRLRMSFALEALAAGNAPMYFAAEATINKEAFLGDMNKGCNYLFHGTSSVFLDDILGGDYERDRIESRLV